MLAFVHIEKAAGTTLGMILARSYGVRHCVPEAWRSRVTNLRAADLRSVRWFYPGLVSISGHVIRPFLDLEQAAPNIRYYTILREPLARCASHYQHQVRHMGKTVAFEDWIAEERFQDFMTRKFVGQADVEAAKRCLRDRMICVGLMEQFDETLILLRRAIDHPPLDIRYSRVRVAEDNTIKQQLLNDPTKRALLERHNQLDLELYRYAAEELFPQQVQAYGPAFEQDLAAFRELNARTPTGPNFNSRAAGYHRRFVMVPALRFWRALFYRDEHPQP